MLKNMQGSLSDIWTRIFFVKIGCHAIVQILFLIFPKGLEIIRLDKGLRNKTTVFNFSDMFRRFDVLMIVVVES